MFVSALLDAYVVLGFGVATWALVMPAFGIANKSTMFVLGFAALRLIGRRLRSLSSLEREALVASTGH